MFTGAVSVPVPASAPDSAAPARLPLAVFVLGAAVFALGTSEFMLSGLLPQIADDMDVSIPTAGLLISAFAIGMVVGAPLLAAATLRLPRRATLVGLLAVFGAGHAAGALAPGYGVLFASRVVSALACAGFWAVGAAVAVSLVPRGARARAMAVMIGGLSIANIAGVPGGALLGQQFGWRAAFWSVLAMTVVALAGIVLLVPAGRRPGAGEERPRLRAELPVFRRPQLWLAVVTTALFAAATFCLFSYLAPLLTEVTGLEEGWVPVVLVLFGGGALVGTIAGGRVADAHMFGTLYAGLTASAVVLALMAVTAHVPFAAVALSGLLGVAAFSCAPALNARIFNVASGAPTLAGATATAAFNTGNTLGPWLGGLVIDAGLGYRWTAGAGVLLLAGALTATAAQARAAGRARIVASGGSGRSHGSEAGTTRSAGRIRP